MSFLQIRSHAQKYFLKVQKNGTVAHVPPPRPKRKAAHPYPQKESKNGLLLFHTMMFCFLKAQHARSWHAAFWVLQFWCHYQLPWHMFLPCGMKISCSWILDPTDHCPIWMNSPIFMEMKACAFLFILSYFWFDCSVWDEDVLNWTFHHLFMIYDVTDSADIGSKGVIINLI